MSASLQLFGLSTIQALMMVDSFSLYSFDFRLQLQPPSFLFLLLGLRPLQYSSGFVPILSKLFLFLLVILVGLAIFHFEFWHVVSRFVLMVAKVELDDRAIPDGESLPFFSALKCWVIKRDLWLFVGVAFILLLLWNFGFAGQNISSSQIQGPLFVICFRVADLDSSEKLGVYAE